MPHITTYSFCFDNLNHHNDNLPSTTAILRDRLKSLYPHLNSMFTTQNKKYSCLTISGTATDVLSARSDVLKLRPIEVTLFIHSLYPGLAYRNIARNRLHEQLELIAIEQDIQIVVDYNRIVIRLIGSIDKVEMARINVLLFFDGLLGLVSSNINLPLYTINILGNRRHANILSIMEETGTNIYLPSPWSKITPTSSNSTTTSTTITAAAVAAESECIIVVTGNTIEAVQRATTLLRKLLPQKIKSMCNLQSVLNPRKRDWLLLYKKDELTKIMRDNGAYISFPTFGSEISQIHVYAENNINVERTLRSLNYLTSHIFQAIIYVNTVQSADIVAHLSQESGAEVIYRTDLNQFEITGSKDQIQSIVQIIRSLPISQEYHKSVIFSIELALDQREFISGKKNGKINKIMKSCDADIQFQVFNDFNFIITIESEDFFKAKDGLDSLQNELPAEISFFVPEICHRRIIGVAGKNIQRVMKQYGVYVKFSSNEELVTFGGYFENEHNVVARTPEKNIHSLQKLKTAVMEFITFQKDRDYVSRLEYVPSYAHRNLLYLNGKYLRDKGRLYNSKIIWPERNGTDHVSIIGPQSHIEEMQSRVQSLLPQFMDIQVPASVVLENILDSPEIEDLQDKIYSKTNIFLILPENLIITTNSSSTTTTAAATTTTTSASSSSSTATSNNGVIVIDNIIEDRPSTYHQMDVPIFRIEGKSTNIALFSPNDCRVLTFKLCFDSNTKNALLKARQMFDTFMGNRYVPVDDTLSPSPEDMLHISPSVMHHIDHPESYEGSGGHAVKNNTNVTELLEQPRSSISHQFYSPSSKKQQPSLSSSTSLHTSTAKSQQQQHQDAMRFFSPSSSSSTIVTSSSTTIKRSNYDQQGKIPTSEEFNVWSENGLNHETQKSNFESHANDMNFRLRSNNGRLYDTTLAKSQQQFYYPPRPELKPHYSTSTASNRYANHDLNYTMNGSSYYQMVGHSSSQQQRNDYITSPTVDVSNNNPFAPIGYSRQRSTSLLPTIGSHHHHHNSQQPQRHHHQQLNSGGGMGSNNHHADGLINKNGNSGGSSTSSFGVYPMYMPPSSHVGLNSSSTTTSNDYYMMNSRMYPVERKNPSSSLSTPIPVAVNSNNNNSMTTLDSQRFNFF